MAKESSTDKEARRREKKEKKEKRSDTDGVHKSKKDKKDKKITVDVELDVAGPNAPESTEEDKTTTKAGEDNGETHVAVNAAPLLGALVPFANPLADEKVGRRVLKGVKKAAKYKSLKRGVKEVVKSLRKSNNPSTSAEQAPGIVILAADISPMDVISHIPVLCEDHAVPYIFVPSRAELGAASSTKRPTSVVMVGSERGGKRKAGEEKEEGEEDFAEVYKDLFKIVQKASRDVRV